MFDTLVHGFSYKALPLLISEMMTFYKTLFWQCSLVAKQQQLVYHTSFIFYREPLDNERRLLS